MTGCGPDCPGQMLLALGRGVGRRAATVTDLMVRSDSFVALPRSPGGGGQGEADGASPADPAESRRAATALVLRALHVISESRTFELAVSLGDGELTTRALAGRTGQPRLVVWAQVSDLVAAGLAGHTTGDDLVRLTEAGEAAVAVVRSLAGATGAGERPLMGGRSPAEPARC